MFAFLAVCALLFVVGFTIVGLTLLYWPIDHLLIPVTAATIACQMQNYMRRYRFVSQQPRAGFIIDFVRYGGYILLLFVLVPKLELKAPGCLLIAAQTKWLIRNSLPPTGICRENSHHIVVY